VTPASFSYDIFKALLILRMEAGAKAATLAMTAKIATNLNILVEARISKVIEKIVILSILGRGVLVSFPHQC